jgi:hypothetical protein
MIARDARSAALRAVTSPIRGYNAAHRNAIGFGSPALAIDPRVLLIKVVGVGTSLIAATSKRPSLPFFIHGGARPACSSAA